MAQQITIDIVAETNKLVSGVNDATNQIDGMNSKLKGLAGAAGAAASAFIARQGVTFLKQGIDEAREAAETLQKATTTFGEGSVALQKITEDAEKFGKAIAVDNDTIIALSTQLGSRLPADAKALSAEIINLAYDVEAYTAGAVTSEAVSGKLAKAFADGELTAKELSKIFPDLSDATYTQAEALSKAGKNQEALTLLIGDGQAKYGDAAEKNVTSSQKFDTALANLKETVGTSVLPIVEKFIDKLTTLLEWFDKQPDSIKKIEIGLGLLIGVGGLALTFLASMKTSMVTLGIINTATAGTTTAAATATNLLSTAMRALPILAIIALIVLLVQNWDTVKEVVDKVWNAIKDFGANAWKVLKDFGKKVGDFVGDVVDEFKKLPGTMLSIGKDIVSGIWNGMKSMAGWLKDKVFDFFGNLIPGWAKKVLGIGSPSKVFARYGRFIVEGLAVGIERSADLAKAATEGLGVQTIGAFGNVATPQLATATPRSNPVSITINAGAGTDPYALGRTVQNALAKYSTVSNKTGESSRL